jgi:hypothetical protein
MNAAEAHHAQGHMMHAVQIIVSHMLPLTPDGAAEVERIMREVDEGRTALWSDPDYFPNLIRLAQGAVREARKGYRRETCH